MDASHILVGGLTAVTLGLLVWIELRSRRNTAMQEQAPVAAERAVPELQPRLSKRSRGRRGVRFKKHLPQC